MRKPFARTLDAEHYGEDGKMVKTSKALSWTQNEDGALLRGLAQHGNDWDSICLGRFNGEQCQARYSKMPFQNAYVLAPDQQLKGGNFDGAEQRAQIALMKRFPPTGKQKRQDWAAMITYDKTLTPRTLPGRDARSLGDSWGNACKGKTHYLGGALRAYMEEEYPGVAKAPAGKKRSKGAVGAEASDREAKKGKQ